MQIIQHSYIMLGEVHTVAVLWWQCFPVWHTGLWWCQSTVCLHTAPAERYMCDSTAHSQVCYKGSYLQSVAIAQQYHSIKCKHITNNKFFDIMSVLAPPSLYCILTYSAKEVPVPPVHDMMMINGCKHFNICMRKLKWNINMWIKQYINGKLAVHENEYCAFIYWYVVC